MLCVRTRVLSVCLWSAYESASYDSSLGAYDPLTAGQHGNIATNGISGASINLRKGSAINGQLIVGPGLADPMTAVSMASDVVVTASPIAVSAPQALDMPAVTTAGITCASDLNLPKNATFTLTQAGSPYCFKQINADSGSKIAVSGNVVVYAETVDFDKNLSVNEGGKPTQLLLNVYGSADVVIDKEGTFVGGLYAPESRVTLKKKNDFYGAIVAEDIEADKDSNFHYDESLKNVGPAGNYETSIIAWRDL